MQPTAIQTWLKRKAASEAAGSFLFATLCFAGGIVVLVITFFFAYGIVWYGFNFGVSGFSELIFGRRLRLSHNAILVVCSLFVGLLFWGNARTSREYLGTLPRRNYPGSALGSISLLSFPGALVSLLAYPGASAKMITDLLFTGPRLVTIAWSNARKAGRLKCMDTVGCARALAVLLQKNSRCSFADLTELACLPDPLTVFRQLRDVEGAVFLTTEPAGLSLTSDLRAELRRVVGSETLVAEEEQATGLTGSPTSLQEMLGVSPSASLEEIESAYRKRLRDSVPENYSDWGRELQMLAQEQAKAVNIAYEVFLEKQRGQQPDESKGERKEVERVWERYNRRRN